MKSHVWIFLLISISTFIDGECFFNDFVVKCRQIEGNLNDICFSNVNCERQQYSFEGLLLISESGPWDASMTDGEPSSLDCSAYENSKYLRRPIYIQCPNNLWGPRNLERPGYITPMTTETLFQRNQTCKRMTFRVVQGMPASQAISVMELLCMTWLTSEKFSTETAMFVNIKLKLQRSVRWANLSIISASSAREEIIKAFIE